MSVRDGFDFSQSEEKICSISIEIRSKDVYNEAEHLYGFISLYILNAEKHKKQGYRVTITKQFPQQLVFTDYIWVFY